MSGARSLSATARDQPFVVSRVRVRRASGADKAVLLPAETDEVIMGAHSEIAAHLGVDPDHPQRASTLDYVVGATAACLTGTLARALKGRGIAIGPDDHRVEATGDIYDRDKVLVLERITVRHTLRLPAEHHDVARRVHGFYHRGCPVSRSLAGAIAIDSELHLSST
jgi:uncharacterized OsmC-like protein